MAVSSVGSGHSGDGERCSISKHISDIQPQGPDRSELHFPQSIKVCLLSYISKAFLKQFQIKVPCPHLSTHMHIYAPLLDLRKMPQLSFFKFPIIVSIQ